jgi:uncharacterized protein (DUF3084 family)
MFRKLFWLGLLVAGGLVIFKTTTLGKQIRDVAQDAWAQATEKKKNGSVQKEIDRLREELIKLEPEIKKNRSALANELVAIDELNDEIRRRQANLQRQYDEILAHKKKVDAGAELVSYQGVEYPSRKVRELLASDWEAYEGAKKALEKKQELLAAKQAWVRDTRKQLANWATTRDLLAAELDELEAEVKMIQLAETRNILEVDNSKLSHFMKSLAEAKKKVRVMQKEAELRTEFPNRPARVETNRSQSIERAWKAMEEAERNGDGKVVTK